MFSEDFTSVFAEDSMVLYFGWGLLLAELAACHAYWRVRLQEWSLGLAEIFEDLQGISWIIISYHGFSWTYREIIFWTSRFGDFCLDNPPSQKDSHELHEELPWISVYPYFKTTPFDVQNMGRRLLSPKWTIRCDLGEPFPSHTQRQIGGDWEQFFTLYIPSGYLT